MDIAARCRSHIFLMIFVSTAAVVILKVGVASSHDEYAPLFRQFMPCSQTKSEDF